MATHIINEYTDGRQIPFKEFTIVFPADTVNFKNLYEGAIITITPITKTDDNGMPFTVAYRIDANASAWENNFEELLPVLQLINKTVPSRIDFVLKGETAQIDINVLDAINVDSWGCYAVVNGDGDFPSLNIIMTGLFSPDLIDMSTNKLFNQNW